jgi:hypothetical protein
MPTLNYPVSVLACFILTLVFLAVPDADAEPFSGAVVRLGANASPVEARVGQLLVDRLNEVNATPVLLAREGDATDVPSGHLLVLLGKPESHGAIAALMEEYRIAPLTELAPGQEGFLLTRIEDGVVLAAGIDDRGCLYAIGELLRQTAFPKSGFTLPDDLHVRTAPAFEIRGTQYGQSHIAKRLGNVRDWTDTETQRAILDYALAGANVFSTRTGPMMDFIKSYGLMTLGTGYPNKASGEYPPEWDGFESIGRKGYLCLSVPDAWNYLLEQSEKRFSRESGFDIIKLKGGDGGGCECDRCDPYGEKFIQISEAMAAIIHKYHPDTRIFVINQKFDDADDEAIFDYLRAEPREWLWAFGYGPGSDATTWQPGHRQTHRMDLFRYPGYGPYALYPREIIRQLPPRHGLVYFNEITHWKYAQHAYIQMYPRADRNGDLPPWWSHEIYEAQPDQALTMVYNRLTWYAWPKRYYRVFEDLMHYGIGDITHSSGHHDHFNQWMWQRLLWAPRTTVDDVVDDYCRTWFGPDAADTMAKAIFQLEENLVEVPGKPLSMKAGVPRYYGLVKEAGKQMPAHLMQNNWAWRAHMEKAALDRHTQLAVTQQENLQKKVERRVGKALTSGKTDNMFDEVLPWFDALDETADMRKLREEAVRLGEESNALYGMRNEGVYNLEHDFIGLGWLKRQLERARDAEGDARLELLRMITDYEDAGEGGRYDNLGTGNPAPNVAFGYPYDHGQPYVHPMLDEGNRPSQRSMHFTQDEDQGVTLHYRDLDPNASYRIRFTLVRPWFQERYNDRMNQKSQTIYADDAVLAADVELPFQMSDFFTYDIPAEATADGELIIRMERGADVARGDRVIREQWRNSGGWGTLLSEAWLMKQ